MSESLPPFQHSTGYKLTQSPDPSWKPGDGLGDSESAREWRAAEEQGWKVVDPTQTNKIDLYRLMTSGIVPRPIGFVSSLSAEGIPNLAPFSWFNMLSHDPPLIIFSVTATSKGDKDTAKNIRHSKDFTVNIISHPWANAANFASIDAPEDISEWAASGLRMEKSNIVKPAWVRESVFAMECEVYQFIDIPSPESESSPLKIMRSLVIGLVKLIHVRNAVLTPSGTVDPALLKPLVRLGGASYAKLGEGFDIPRLVWSEHEERVRDLQKKAQESIL